jgi:hypothetical protein
MAVFEVGEVAIYWREGSPYHKEEVIITHPLHETIGIDMRTGRLRSGWAYGIDCPAFHPLPLNCSYPVVPPECLRKRPPDWNALVRETELPDKVECV